MQWLQEIVPFLKPYPVWVKILVSAWVILSAACVISLVIFSPTTLEAKKGGAFLRIDGVRMTDGSQPNVRVYASVGQISFTTFTYPNLNDVRWMQVGPNMLPKLSTSQSRTVTGSGLRWRLIAA